MAALAPAPPLPVCCLAVRESGRPGHRRRVLTVSFGIVVVLIQRSPPLRPPQPSPGGGAAERAVHDGPSPAGSWIPLRWVGAVARSTASARSVDGSLLGGPSARPPDGPLTVARLGRPQLAQEPNPRMSAISYKHIANRVQRSPGAGVTAVRRSGSSAAGADRPVGATLAQSSPRAAQCAAPRTPARCPAWRRSARRLLCSSMASAEVRTAHGPSAKRGARQLQR
jgi:hypothetical protein